jgi:hypothetical protein
MAGKAKPAPRQRARASDDVRAGERDSQKNISTQTKFQQPGEIAIYDSLDFIGRLVPKGIGYLAFTAQGRFLGQRGSSRIAASLVDQASNRPGAAR